ncbi:sensor histidine kinase [Paenibacillus hamazuiensis]|uniref:sensor histidine kinase n=1 Tax=Paenibacillus hamazuiensis TaxID=2936508 RepID=UPI003B84B69E
MSLKTLKLFTILLPPLIIGGFEYFRHEVLLHMLSMEVGNFYITVLTLLLSFLFAQWMFRKIERMSRRLAEERAHRAVYEERERLARELHDNIAQMLFFLNVKLKQGKTEEARSAVTEIDNHLRQAIFNLRTPPGEGISLRHRTRVWLQEWSAMTGIEAELRYGVPDGVFDVSQELQLFGIIQEACTNIRKHSRASRAVVTLEWHRDTDGRPAVHIRSRGESPVTDSREPGRSSAAAGRLKGETPEGSGVPAGGAPAPGSGSAGPGPGQAAAAGWRLSIKDDGIGMAVPSPDPTAYGLTLLRKRARELGGELRVHTAPGAGTEIEIVGKGGSFDEIPTADRRRSSDGP